MSTKGIVFDINDEIDVPKTVRVHSLEQFIKCNGCEEVVSNCKIALVNYFTEERRLGMKRPVQIHDKFLFVETEDIHPFTPIFGQVGLEINNIDYPLECKCSQKSSDLGYRLCATFPLCHHNDKIENTDNTISTLIHVLCERDHSNEIDICERDIDIRMRFNSDNNVWESRPNPIFKLSCDNNLRKSANKR
jgi:hypothetical protein